MVNLINKVATSSENWSEVLGMSEIMLRRLDKMTGISAYLATIKLGNLGFYSGLLL